MGVVLKVELPVSVPGHAVEHPDERQCPTVVDRRCTRGAVSAFVVGREDSGEKERQRQGRQHDPRRSRHGRGNQHPGADTAEVGEQATCRGVVVALEQDREGLGAD